MMFICCNCVARKAITLDWIPAG